MKFQRNDTNRTALELINRVDPSLSLECVLQDQGFQAQVYLVSRRGEKLILKSGSNEPMILEALQGIENIPKLVAIYNDRGKTIFLKEFIPGKMRGEITLSAEEIKLYTNQAKRLVDKIHTHQVYYLDPHPDNIIINNGVYLFDFNISCLSGKDDAVPIDDFYRELDQRQIKTSLEEGIFRL